VEQLTKKNKCVNGNFSLLFQFTSVGLISHNNNMSANVELQYNEMCGNTSLTPAVGNAEVALDWFSTTFQNASDKLVHALNWF